MFMLNKFSKRGQGLSLNVIIIAALALIVLVVLVVIFTSRSAQTSEQVDSIAGDAALELQKVKLSYADCSPSSSTERDFTSSYGNAANDGDRDSAVNDLKDEVRRCRGFGQEECSNVGCSWN